MKNSDRRALSLSFWRMRKAIAKGDSTVKEMEQARAQIAADTDHSEQWKNKQLAELSKKEGLVYRICGDAVGHFAAQAQKQIDNLGTSFDYNSPRFQNALRTIQVLGKHTPMNIRDSIVKDFTGDQDALSALKGLFEQYDFNTEGIDTRLKPFDLLSGNLIENENMTRFLAFSTADMVNPETGDEIAPTWNPFAVKDILSRYEKAFDLRTGANPLISEMEDFISTHEAKDPATRRAADFLKSHRDEMEQGLAQTCERAERALENDFSPKWWAHDTVDKVVADA